MAPAAGGAGSSSGAPRETLLHSPGRGGGLRAPSDRQRPALQGSRFAVSVRPLRPGFTNRSARFHPAARSLLFLVSLPSSPATRGVMSRMWIRRCHTRYVGAARGSRWVLCLHFGHPQPRKQATLILGGECSAQERYRGEKCSAV